MEGGRERGREGREGGTEEGTEEKANGKAMKDERQEKEEEEKRRKERERTQKKGKWNDTVEMQSLHCRHLGSPTLMFRICAAQHFIADKKIGRRCASGLAWW